MTSKQSMFVFIVGFILTLGSVGGIEVASDSELLSCMIFASLGLLIMYCGTLGFRNAHYFD
jgi:hypothetical protein